MKILMLFTVNMRISSVCLTILFCGINYNCAVFLFEGDSCNVQQTNATGKCIQVQKCPYALDLLKKGENPHFCGFIGNTPLVCCPSSQKIKNGKPGALARKMCLQYKNVHNQVFAINNGMKALVKEFPHMAAIGYGDTMSSLVWLCGGSLISHYYILTAAHCAYSLDYGRPTYVRLGDLDLQNTTEEANPQDLKIVEMKIHPKYKPSSHYHDIALLKVGEKIQFEVYFKPACLQTEKNLFVDVLQATGWGRLGFFGDRSSHLMKVNLTIVDYKTCAERYSDIAGGRKLKDGILDETQLCAGDSSGKDTCPGDSGGPLHYFQNGTEDLVDHYIVAGITSFGKGCGVENSVGVYTRVSAYIEWIENNVWPENI